MNLRRQRSRLLWLLMLSPLTGFGQIYVDGVAIDTLNTPFCQLICTNPTLLSRTWVQIDYGQRYVSSGLNRQKIAGADREPITFNSTIDALNFMIRNGWELVSSQVTANDSGSERSLYLPAPTPETDRVSGPEAKNATGGSHGQPPVNVKNNPALLYFTYSSSRYFTSGQSSSSTICSSLSTS